MIFYDLRYKSSTGTEWSISTLNNKLCAKANVEAVYASKQISGVFTIRNIHYDSTDLRSTNWFCQTRLTKPIYTFEFDKKILYGFDVKDKISFVDFTSIDPRSFRSLAPVPYYRIYKKIY
jgi:hypothetical protein